MLGLLGHVCPRLHFVQTVLRTSARIGSRPNPLRVLIPFLFAHKKNAFRCFFNGLNVGIARTKLVLVFALLRPSFGRPLASARDRTLCGFLSPSYSLIKKNAFRRFFNGLNVGIARTCLSSSSLRSDRPSDVRSHRLATEPITGSYPLPIRP